MGWISEPEYSPAPPFKRQKRAERVPGRRATRRPVNRGFCKLAASRSKRSATKTRGTAAPQLAFVPINRTFRTRVSAERAGIHLSGFRDLDMTACPTRRVGAPD